MPKVREWTKDEDKRIESLRRKGIPYKDMPPFFEDRSQDAIRNRWWVLSNRTAQHWLEEEVIGHLDIESSNLKANIGYMLSWAIKYDGGAVVTDCITKKDLNNNPEFPDRRIMKSLLDEMKKIDVFVTYYGTGFDIPYMRTRALMMGLDFPEYGQKKHIDCYYMVRSLMKLHRSSLDAATAAIGVPGKTPVDVRTWRLAQLGKPSALKEVLDHNKADVVILEKLFNRLRKFRKITRKSL